jgi:peroxiredoxin
MGPFGQKKGVGLSVSPIEIVLAVLLALTMCGAAWSAFHLITQNGRLLLRLESLERRLVQQGLIDEGGGLKLGRPPGSVLNDFALPILGGGTMTLSQWRGRKVALIFMSPGCTHCVKLLPDLAVALAGRADSDPAPVIISSGSADQNRQLFAQYSFSCPILLQEDSEVAALYQASATPMAYLVDEKGVTIGSAALGPSAVLSLVRGEARAAEAPANGHSRVGTHQSLASSRINRDGLKAGAVAPDFTLPALDGAEISLSSFRGKPVLLVFSDPNCAPCNQILPHLEQIHQKSEDLRVLMIGRGDPEANREKSKSLGLTFPVVLQRSWEISRDYGMFATPIGYLIDENGILLSDVAVGGNAILALAAKQGMRALG